MADGDIAWPGAVPDRLRPALARAAAGTPANVALMHLLMECESRDEAESAVAATIAALQATGDSRSVARLRAMLELLRANPQAFKTVRDTVAGLDHGRAGNDAEDNLAYWRDAFNMAARCNPEGSAALYALGSPALLEAATNEIADWLAQLDLLGPAVACLDIGCGIGRLEIALAERIAQIVGVDIAPAMVSEARRRTLGLSNVTIREANGRDLGEFADADFDLVIAVDSFPYMVQAGGDLVRSMVGEIARVLRPAGHAVILNYSYRGDVEADEAELGKLGAATGLRLLRSGASDFTLWDAASFVLQRS
jgi:SAM-dependent methyltransferase